MNLRARHAGTASFLGAEQILDGFEDLIGPDVRKAFGQFARRAAGDIRLVRLGVIENLPVRKVLGGNERTVLGQRGRNGKIPGRDDAQILVARGVEAGVARLVLDGDEAALIGDQGARSVDAREHLDVAKLAAGPGHGVAASLMRARPVNARFVQRAGCARRGAWYLARPMDL